MVFILYFLIVGSALMFYILKFDTHQHKRMSKLYKENEDLQPLFLKKSAEQKLKTLNTKLYGVANPAPTESEATRVSLNGSPKGLVARQLAELIHNYDAGTVDIKTYNAGLSEMLAKVKEPKVLPSAYKIPAK
jgi:hypothetical protein